MASIVTVCPGADTSSQVEFPFGDCSVVVVGGVVGKNTGHCEMVLKEYVKQGAEEDNHLVVELHD